MKKIPLIITVILVLSIAACNATSTPTPAPVTSVPAKATAASSQPATQTVIPASLQTPSVCGNIAAADFTWWTTVDKKTRTNDDWTKLVNTDFGLNSQKYGFPIQWTGVNMPTLRIHAYSTKVSELPNEVVTTIENLASQNNARAMIEKSASKEGVSVWEVSMCKK